MHAKSSYVLKKWLKKGYLTITNTVRNLLSVSYYFRARYDKLKKNSKNLKNIPIKPICNLKKYNIKYVLLINGFGKYSIWELVLFLKRILCFLVNYFTIII